MEYHAQCVFFTRDSISEYLVYHTYIHTIGCTGCSKSHRYIMRGTELRDNDMTATCEGRKRASLIVY